MQTQSGRNAHTHTTPKQCSEMWRNTMCMIIKTMNNEQPRPHSILLMHQQTLILFVWYALEAFFGQTRARINAQYCALTHVNAHPVASGIRRRHVRKARKHANGACWFASRFVHCEKQLGYATPIGAPPTILAIAPLMLQLKWVMLSVAMATMTAAISTSTAKTKRNTNGHTHTHQEQEQEQEQTQEEQQQKPQNNNNGHTHTNGNESNKQLQNNNHTTLNVNDDLGTD